MGTANHLANSHHLYFMTVPNSGGRQLTLTEADICLKLAKLSAHTKFGNLWSLPTKQTIYEIFSGRRFSMGKGVFKSAS